MNRRKFISSTASAGLAAGAAAPGATVKKAIYELRYFYLRNDNQVSRTHEFLSALYVPALTRAGAGPIGCFSQFISERGPFALMVVSYPSLAAKETIDEKIMHDEELLKGLEKYSTPGEQYYVRQESSLLRAFDCQPEIAVPKAAEKGAHVFELRTYESPNGAAGRRKVKMFNDAEAGIFRRLGMQPVFFGETIIGRNQPSLTYMLTFDDLAARDRMWSAFGADAEWKKLRAQPELADALIVSNISNTILRPLPFSQIK